MCSKLGTLQAKAIFSDVCSQDWPALIENRNSRVWPGPKLASCPSAGGTGDIAYILRTFWFQVLATWCAYLLGIVDNAGVRKLCADCGRKASQQAGDGGHFANIASDRGDVSDFVPDSGQHRCSFFIVMCVEYCTDAYDYNSVGCTMLWNIAVSTCFVIWWILTCHGQEGHLHDYQ